MTCQKQLKLTNRVKCVKKSILPTQQEKQKSAYSRLKTPPKTPKPPIYGGFGGDDNVSLLSMFLVGEVGIEPTLHCWN